jgi:hypothetical protein
MDRQSRRRERPGALSSPVGGLQSRLAAVGLAADDQFKFPVTAVRLAEALGSTVSAA